MPPLANEYRINPGQLDKILTPALLIYPKIVESNIRATLTMAGNDPNRWRPHLKTAKAPAVTRMLMDAGVRQFKCSTTLELLKACEAGAGDVLLAFPAVGANAVRVRQLIEDFPKTRISVLTDRAEQIQGWSGDQIGIFIDVNPGMDRTGVEQTATDEILKLSKLAGRQFRGLHYYDGHMAGVPPAEREARTHEGYERLMGIEQTLRQAGAITEEVITSGTPAAPYALSFPGFKGAPFIHRISPGTVVYNDMTSLEQLPDFGYRPAALVLTSVVSCPRKSILTCDAGHKSVSADAGVPTCIVLGHDEFRPLKPSEEHLPIHCDPDRPVPAVGDKLYLLPRHVCPTVNNFDDALFVADGRVSAIERVAARGHEQPIFIEPLASDEEIPAFR